MAISYEYWSAAFAVGLEGLNDWDQGELNSIAAEGWEPFLMTSTHGGFATLILFRREMPAARPSARKKAAPVKKAAAVNKAPVKKAPVKKAPVKEAAAERR